MEGVSFPTTGEQIGITITDEDIAVNREKGERCLIGRVRREKKINKDVFRKSISRLWRTGKPISFKEIQENLWVFEFSDEADKKRVLEGRPWAYERQIMVLDEFNRSVPPSQLKFCHTPCWIQVHNMPLNCMSRMVRKKIGETLGVLEEVNVARDGSVWGRYLRL